MIWTYLTALTCLALCVKMIFFTEADRVESRLGYRILLFISTVAFGWRFIDILYHADQHVGFFNFIVYLALLIGSFHVRWWHLPGNLR